MRVIALFFGIIAALTGALPSPAAAAARRALVIGIDSYQAVNPLRKAVGDAEAMASTLRGLGFEVDLATNTDRRGLTRAISSFLGKVKPGDVTFFHYSGHGVEIDGENYLLPADIPDPKPGEKEFVKAEALGLSGLTDSFAQTGAAVRIFVVDACRDNPFSANATRSLGGLSRGLARPATPEGTFILYSAGERQTALDRLSDSDATPTSVFTRVLTENLARKGVPLNDIAKDVRIEVASLAKSVGHVQTPAVYDEVTGRFYLNGEESGAQAAVTPPSAPPPPKAPSTASSEEADWNVAVSIGTADAYEVFAEAYPGTVRAKLARAKIKAEKEAAKPEEPEEQVAAVDPVEPPPAPPPSPSQETTLPATAGESKATGIWSHNGSELYLVASEAKRSFVYLSPSDVLKSAGVERGTVLFEGEAQGGRYRGTAWLFSRFCPPFPYPVEGPITNGSRQVRLSGRKPKRDRACVTTGWQDEMLVFDFSRRAGL